MDSASGQDFVPISQRDLEITISLYTMNIIQYVMAISSLLRCFSEPSFQNRYFMLHV